MTEFFNHYISESNSEYSLIIEDDGRVCYAYLLFKDEVISDVWIYNQSPSPINVNWEDRSETPFLNPKQFVDEKNMINPISYFKDIIIEWDFLEKRLVAVEIYFKKVLLAVLQPNVKPGWALSAIKDGPLAKSIQNLL